MISEEQQDQAALYALGLLDAAEAGAFEAAVQANPELGNFVRELRDAAGEVASLAPRKHVPVALKDRVLSDAALQKQQSAHEPRRILTWIPWAIAAAVAIFCGKLALDQRHLERELATARSADPFSRTKVVTLTTTPAAKADSKAAVAWEQEKQTGMIRVTNMPAPAAGKDYQLWIVDAEHQDPISGGLIRVNDKGVGEVRFRPNETVRQVKAFAISVEREGGVPRKQGPIVMIGTA